MRLTADVLLRSEQFINAYLDREITLRGYRLPEIENLAVLQDQFDVIDFSDNEIKKLDNFPVMQRLNAIICNNNRVLRIAANLGSNLPNLSTVILTNNRIANLSEIDSLASAVKLEILSLLDNPVSTKPNFRLYTIYKIPSLKWLDYRKVTKTERDESSEYFQSAAGKVFIATIEREKELLQQTANSAANLVGVNGTTYRPIAPVILTDEQKLLVKKAIKSATTKEQIDFIETQLKSGNVEAVLARVVTPNTDELSAPDATKMTIGQDEDENETSRVPAQSEQFTELAMSVD